MPQGGAFLELLIKIEFSSFSRFKLSLMALNYLQVIKISDISK